MTFYDKLKVLCDREGIAPTTLVRNLGMSGTNISYWKTNQRDPQMRIMKRIADYFEVPMSYFLSDGDQDSEMLKEESNIAPIDGYKLYNLPVYESVSAGFGSYASDFVVEYMPLPLKSDEEAKDSLVIKVVGDSMYPKIEDGDYVQVRKQTSVDSGTLAVVLLDEEEGFIKRVKYGADFVTLLSNNPAYEPMIFTGKDVLRLRVVGKVQKIIKEP